MYERDLFVDNRLTGRCVYCGATPETKDHCPSRVLLDEPFPPDLPVVDACESCNLSFATDKEYLACFVECVICGSAEPEKVSRQKVRRILEKNSKLANVIRQSAREEGRGNLAWEPEQSRIQSVVTKLAKGHLAYELGVPHLSDPAQVLCVPFLLLSQAERSRFEMEDQEPFTPWPEIGSRAFFRASGVRQTNAMNGWIVVQPKRYRYFVGSDATFVHIALSEYLACRVTWDG